MRFLFFFIFLNTLFLNLAEARSAKQKQIVIEAKKIDLEEFSGAFNPSLIKTDHGFLLTFRYCLHPIYPWISYIGIAMLDEELNLVSKPQLLNTREDEALTPSQAEDARIFTAGNKIYVIYNDNEEVVNPSGSQRRDMFIAEVVHHNGEFKLEKPLKVMHEKKYAKKNWQKNWVPFEWNNQICLGYSIVPHEILTPNIDSGIACAKSISAIKNSWKWGELRGGTPAILVDDNYLGFFHSSKVSTSSASSNIPMHHYYMGAYLFSSKPPFDIKKISSSPIVANGFYTQSDYEKRVIFPGGFAVVDDTIYLAYGKDDMEVWIAIIHKKNLINSLKSTKKKRQIIFY
ncbi:MAG TPA: hypothetical protein PLC42_04105 [Parachlamydiaceae bacterium]|nr:hypothetical protein [Parachlamydiaceae bacterium]